jgi:hypothetical protein
MFVRVLMRVLVLVLVLGRAALAARRSSSDSLARVLLCFAVRVCS